MKCPKCGYLGFERVERCRNCGYDFSLTEAPNLPELPIRTSDPEIGPLEDLTLADPTIRRTPRAAAELAAELPLFVSGGSGAPGGPNAPKTLISDDQPLIKTPASPRPPLAVRRATPDLPRLRGEQPKVQSLDLDLGAPSIDAPSAASPNTAVSSTAVDRRPGLERPSVERSSGERLAVERPVAERTTVARRLSEPSAAERSADATRTVADAGLIARFMAAVIDVAILAAIDAVVIYFTMQICGLTVADLSVLPRAPLLAFLLVQNGGYLVAFSVSGQTLGKMVARIKVVTAGSLSRLDLGRALLRTLVWLILALPAGLGFLTALFSSDRRGLHDRCAGTRVVRALA